MLRLAPALRLVAGAVLVAYPFVVWLGLGSRSPRAIAALLLVALAPVVLLRLRAVRGTDLGALAGIPLITAASLALASLLDSAGFMLVVPVAINAVLLAAFGASLRPGSTPMITRLARLEDPLLGSEQERWCRSWTRIWCAFFVANGTVAALLAWLAPLAWWASYSGFLSYVLIGALIVLERWLRRRRFAGAPALREDAPL